MAGASSAEGPHHGAAPTLTRALVVAASLVMIATAACGAGSHAQSGATGTTAVPPSTSMAARLQWSTPKQIDTHQGYASVSCATASFCSAVVASPQFGSAIIWNGTSWSAPQVLDRGNVNHVSCPTVAFCMAASSSAFTWNGASWSRGSHLIWPNPKDGITNVSCGSPSFCIAPDVDGDMRIWNGTSWSIEHKVGSDSIACTSASFCMAVDEKGNATSWNGTSFSAPKSIDQNSFAAVSCPSASFCMALDQQGYWLMWNGTSWTTPQAVQPNGPNDHRSGPFVINWVSCPTAGFCVAVGSDGSAIDWNGSSWSAPQSIDPGLAQQGRPFLGVDAVSCPTTQFCAAVFADGNAVIGRQGA